MFKFPRGEFDNFKQVVVMMQKRSQPLQDKARIEEVKFNLENDNIPYIEDIEGTVFKAAYNDLKKTPEINLFRDGKVTEETLFNGLNQVLYELTESDRKENRYISVERGKPIIELLQGHVSQILASGGYNGIMGNLLIKGGCNKVIETTTTKEDDKEIMVETEVLKPYLELTNKNGDILFKDF